jgi:protein required for attachment to host cells
LEATWILVADGARARVFRVERPRGPLIEEASYTHPEERLPEHELASDDPGRVRGAGGRQHAFGPDESLHRQEAGRFAAELARRLREGREKDRFRRLYLVAEPRFLGQLRDARDAGTAERVVGEFDKDLAGHDAKAIREHLPERL